MTDYNALAQRIVAQGVGNHIPGIAIDEYRLGESTYMTAEQFCQDGRVVLALMQKCHKRGKFLAMTVNKGQCNVSADLPLGPAICKVCCEALEVSDAK